MPRLRHSIEVTHPAAAVFGVLADFGQDPRWRANVIEMVPLGREGDIGGIWSRHVEVRQVPGRQIRTEAIITSFVPGQRLAVRRASGPVRPEATCQLSDFGGRTRIDFTLDVELTGIRVLLAPLVWLLLGLVIRPVLPGDFARLSKHLDAALPSSTG